MQQFHSLFKAFFVYRKVSEEQEENSGIDFKVYMVYL